MNFTLWNVSKSVELFWWKCIILPVLSAAIYETAPDGRCRCRRRTAPRRIRARGLPLNPSGEAAAESRPERVVCGGASAAPTGRPDGLGLHPPAGGGRSVLLSGTDRAGTGDAVPHPRLARLRLSARSHGGGNRLVTACVKRRFIGNG